MEPDSTALLIVLLLIVAGALYAMARSRRWFVKVGAAVLAVALAMLAGMAVVNESFGYYRSWSALNADLTGDYNAFGGAPAGTRTIAFRDQHGHLEQIDMAGATSKFDRPALVYLPPQYYQREYASVRFPVVELIHGSPGNPRSWTVHLNVVRIIDKLISAHLMGPVVLVMPTSNSGRDFEECLNSRHGLDDTYVSAEVPADTMRRFRVATDRSEWGIAGLSSGGYCAANLSLRHRGDYGAVGIMDGYFRPRDGEAAGELGFNRRAEAANDPLAAARALSSTTAPLPPFWLAAGSG
ncbi:MAG TPA: alpha/beta hydrolase-fold protein, partial [Jatrophihabitans sp.]|nr:alpha/beta hydrolase-fold protein [Jatrophihabitans sp.]